MKKGPINHSSLNFTKTQVSFSNWTYISSICSGHVNKSLTTKNLWIGLTFHFNVDLLKMRVWRMVSFSINSLDFKLLKKTSIPNKPVRFIRYYIYYILLYIIIILLHYIWHLLDITFHSKKEYLKILHLKMFDN